MPLSQSERNRRHYQRHREEILAKKERGRRAEGARKQPRDGLSRMHWEMIARCHKRGHPLFKNYGARGIKVCDEWRFSLDAFRAYVSEHMGKRPWKRHSIDRKDNDGNYEPGNLRWATYAEQNRNRQRTHYTGKLSADDVRTIRRDLTRGVPRVDLAKRYGVQYSHIWNIEHGKAWADEPITPPVGSGSRGARASRRDSRFAASPRSSRASLRS